MADHSTLFSFGISVPGLVYSSLNHKSGIIGQNTSTHNYMNTHYLNVCLYREKSGVLKENVEYHVSRQGLDSLG